MLRTESVDAPGINGTRQVVIHFYFRIFGLLVLPKAQSGEKDIKPLESRRGYANWVFG